MKRVLPFIACLFLCIQMALGQHKFFSGHIDITSVVGLDVSATLELCAAMGSDLSQIKICLGDGSCKQANLVQQEDFPEFNIQKLKYTISHTYASQAHYTIYFEDCCWNDGKNTQGLASSRFYIYHDFTLYNPQFFTNNSPSIQQAFEVFIAEPSVPLFIQPIITDADADSVQLLLVSPEGDSLVENRYLFPHEADAVAGNDFLIDEFNQIQWDAPEEKGTYHFAYKIKEYRQGDELTSNYGVSTIIVQDSESTAVHENDASSVIQLYPNPTSGVLKIGGEGVTDIFVYNLQACLLLHQKGLEGDLSLLPNGIYFVRVLQDGKNYTGKVIKI